MGAAQLMTANELAGHWRKDKSQSQLDCYSRSLDLLGLGGIQKKCAEKLINGLQIEEKDGGASTPRFSIRFLQYPHRGHPLLLRRKAWSSTAAQLRHSKRR